MSNKHKHQYSIEWAFLGFIVLAAIVVVSIIVKNSTPQNTPPETKNDTTVNTKNTNALATGDEQESGNAEEHFSQEDEQVLELFGFWIPDLRINPPNYTQTISGSTTTYDFGNGNALSIMPQKSLRMVENSLGSITKKNIAIDGRDATFISGTSPKDGTKVNYIIIEHADQSFFLRGNEAFLTKAEKQMKIRNEKLLKKATP